MRNMENIYEHSLPVEQPKIQEESIRIPQDKNMLVVHLKKHTWVTICIKDKEMIRDETPNPIIKFALKPGDYTIRTNGEIEKIETEVFQQVPSILDQMTQKKTGILHLSSDAPDVHVVDGIGEVSADGKSFCTIKIEKVDFDGTLLKGRQHNDELFIRTTGGIIMDDQGNKHIRSLKLKSGKAAFRLVSEENPKVVTVTVLAKGPLLSKAEIQIEFI